MSMDPEGDGGSGALDGQSLEMHVGLEVGSTIVAEYVVIK